jgi:hypothetical protein
VAREYGTNTICHGGVSGSPVAFNVLGMLRHHYDRFMKVADKKDYNGRLREFATPDDEIKTFNLVSVPQFEPWDEEMIMQVLRHELGWKGMPGGRTRHVDCTVAEVSDHLLQRKFGFSKKWMGISARLRAGFVNKKTAKTMIIEEEEKISREPRAAMEIFLEKLELTRETVRALPFFRAEPVFRYL